jgi:hypothetical protein
MRKMIAALILTAVVGGGVVGGTMSASAGRDCTRGYRPCILDRRSDVDCYGGGGNGPRYTRPGVEYRVWGADRYGLDGDNDGVGCEQ